ncbi:hypothetical protein [Alteromonas ponticola]|uniref:Uncharacterized protein n=1 Tax=Alteromonas ponticola TaxID=2720613 RepID=A0ABX1R265_9ALTE|nr:hypothetical protein [Alteromonas ponticola]NMH60560.1 hypothetical protein [Alteromonas ponticola]
MFGILKQKITANRFKRHELGVIENIPADVFQQIIDEQTAMGWESSGSFHQFNWSKKWTLKLRKGTTVLELEWSPEAQGNMVGLQRILTDVAKEFELKVLVCPTY